jgi:hypothetical protein
MTALAPADSSPVPPDVEFAAPRSVQSIEECWFYHVMDLPGLGQVGGQWDLRATADAYFGGYSFSGKRVLDMGAASGFCTFEMERRGASVVSFDMADDGKWDHVPFPLHPATLEHNITQNRLTVERMKNSYWLAHRLLGSRAQACYGNVYDIPQKLGHFDAVMIGQILVHLRDPVAALTSACRMADSVILTEGMMNLPLALASFYPKPGDSAFNYSWWRYSVGLYRRILGILGFEIAQVRSARHRCLVEGAKPWPRLTTIVAHRRKG